MLVGLLYGLYATPGQRRSTQKSLQRMPHNGVSGDADGLTDMSQRVKGIISPVSQSIGRLVSILPEGGHRRGGFQECGRVTEMDPVGGLSSCESAHGKLVRLASGPPTSAGQLCRRRSRPALAWTNAIWTPCSDLGWAKMTLPSGKSSGFSVRNPTPPSAKAAISSSRLVTSNVR